MVAATSLLRAAARVPQNRRAQSCMRPLGFLWPMKMPNVAVICNGVVVSDWAGPDVVMSERGSSGGVVPGLAGWDPGSRALHAAPSIACLEWGTAHPSPPRDMELEVGTTGQRGSFTTYYMYQGPRPPQDATLLLSFSILSLSLSIISLSVFITSPIPQS